MNIGIISLGLIGGSILKALADKEHNLFVCTRNPQTIEKVKKYTSNVSDNMDILKNCEIVFVASPINKTVSVLDKLENYLNKNCIVMDCSSVKEFVMKKRPYKFIASHPMAGTEKNGFDASFSTLFQGAVWVLTPFDDTPQEDIKKAENIINEMGAHIVIADAKEHDKAVALISHFPLLVSQSLFYMIKDNKLAKTLAASGFRDMTRLAMSNLEMAVDMMTFNSENIDFAMNELFKSMTFLKNAKDLKILTDIKNIRSNMYSSEGKNILHEADKN